MPQSVNLVFCGTPAFAVPTLDRLVEAGFKIALVVTQPDRPKGRGLEVVSSPVKQRAFDLGLPISQPERIKNNEDFRAQLANLEPDAIIVVGYGRIIPQWMLGLPVLGNINLHASLLPKYRGAAPIQWAIARGETITGVTTMKIDAGLDTGDILLQQGIPIAPDETAQTLGPKLAAMGADLTVETLRGLQSGSVLPRRQDNSMATLAPILKKEDGLINFAQPAHEILNRLRGFQPWPGAYSKFRAKNLQVWKAKAFDRALSPAELTVEVDRLLVGCGQGTAIEILELQLEGKNRTSAAQFIRGYRLVPGEKLGS
ncbi:MAG: methionyl-tRNA formyltransferase [Candidatus Sulfotelmatobacter sp.]